MTNLEAQGKGTQELRELIAKWRRLANRMHGTSLDDRSIGIDECRYELESLLPAIEAAIQETVRARDAEWYQSLGIELTDQTRDSIEGPKALDSLIERAIERCAKYVEELASEDRLIRDPDLFEVGDKIREAITAASVKETSRAK